MRRAAATALLLVCVLAVPRAQAAEVKSPQGFTIKYPDGWGAANPEQLAQVREQTKQPAAEAFITGPTVGKAHPVVTVLVDQKNGTLPANFAEQIRAQSVQSGKLLEDFRSRNIRVDSRPAISIGIQVPAPEMGEPVRQWLVFIPTGKKTFIIKCEAVKSQWADSAPYFRGMINNFQIAAGQ